MTHITQLLPPKRLSFNTSYRENSKLTQVTGIPVLRMKNIGSPQEGGRHRIVQFLFLLDCVSVNVILKDLQILQY